LSLCWSVLESVAIA